MTSTPEKMGLSEVITNKGSNCSVENSSDAITNPSGKTGKHRLWSWLNSSLKIKMTDGRVLIGIFLCTDRDSNVILSSSVEYLNEVDIGVEQPRVLGLVMVPGRHIISIHYGDDINLNNLLKSY